MVGLKTTRQNYLKYTPRQNKHQGRICVAYVKRVARVKRIAPIKSVACVKRVARIKCVASVTSAMKEPVSPSGDLPYLPL